MRWHEWQPGMVEWSSTEVKNFYVYTKEGTSGGSPRQETIPEIVTIPLIEHSAKLLNWLPANQRSTWLTCRGALKLYNGKLGKLYNESFDSGTIIALDRSKAFYRSQSKDALWGCLSPTVRQQAILIGGQKDPFFLYYFSSANLDELAKELKISWGKKVGANSKWDSKLTKILATYGDIALLGSDREWLQDAEAKRPPLPQPTVRPPPAPNSDEEEFKAPPPRSNPKRPLPGPPLPQPTVRPPPAPNSDEEEFLAPPPRSNPKRPLPGPPLPQPTVRPPPAPNSSTSSGLPRDPCIWSTSLLSSPALGICPEVSSRPSISSPEG